MAGWQEFLRIIASLLEVRVFLSAFVVLEFAVLYLSWAWPRYIRNDES